MAKTLVFFTTTILFSVLHIGFAQDAIVLDHGGGPVRTVAFLPTNGFRVASAGEDKTIKIWNLRNDTVIILKGHTGVINSVAFSPDGRLLASGGENRIKLWNLHRKQNIATLEHIPGAGWGASPITAVTFSPHGQWLASAGYLGVKLWDVGNRTEVATFQHDDWVFAAAFSPDGQFLATEAPPGVVKIWNIQSRQVVAQLDNGQPSGRAVTFSPDGRTLVNTTNTGTINLWDTSDWKLLGSLQNNTPVFAIDFSPTGKTLATTGYETVNLWSVENGDKITSLTGHTGWVRSVAFTPAGNTIASGGDDGTVRVQKIKTHLEAQHLRNMVRLIYFLPNDRQPQPDMDAKLNTQIKEIQRFYANQMEIHGFGRKTFTFETDATGKAVVHRVKGQFPDSHYHYQTWDKVWNEINPRFDVSRNVYLAVIDISSEGFDSTSGHGLVCGRGGVYGTKGGRIIIPASGNCFNFIATAHELGHAFGLFHDFRKDVYLMSYGRFRDELSQCSAEWLDVHPYFNESHTAFNHPIEIQVLPPRAVPPHAIRFRFEVTDKDGLHQIQLLTPATAVHEAPGDPKLLDYKRVSAQSHTVEFVTSQLTTQSQTEVMLQVIDIHGSFAARRFTIDLSAVLPPPTVVFIPDLNLAEALRQKLGVAPGKPITQLDLFKLNELFVYNRQITDLTGIEHARHLKILSLHKGQLSNITPLSKLSNLQHLILPECQLSNIIPLIELTNLTVLDLSYNQLSDITPLTELTNLRWLALGNNRIGNIAPLAELSNLHYLHFWGNQLSDITPLTNLTKLETLYLGENPISDITPLAGLTNLDYLYLLGNQISDITPLTELTNLESLIIGDNQIRDISPLTRLTNLTWLNLSYNQVSDVTPLTELTDLTGLNLSHNQIRDIKPLANLTKLEKVWIPDNQIHDVTSLANLENLTVLHLQGNPIADMSPLRVLLEKNQSITLDILPTLYSEAKITGPWLWIIAPTETNKGGVESLEVDSLDAASGGVVTETNIALNGAKQGDAVGDYVWTLGEIAGHGGNNVNDLVNKIGLVDGGNPAKTTDDMDINDHSAYGLITLESTIDQTDVTMLAGCNDALKIWLNGEVVHNDHDNWMNWEGKDFENIFKVNVKAGDNLLMVKVSEGSGEWSMFVGIDADVKVKQQFTNTLQKIAAPGAPEVIQPIKTRLLPNYPNPFNPETWIPYQLATDADVQIRIYDVRGHIIRHLELGHQRAGYYTGSSHAAYWDGKNALGEPVASGVYFYTLTTGDFTATRKMLIRK